MNAIRSIGFSIAFGVASTIATGGSALALPTIAGGSTFDVVGSLQALPTGATTDQATGVDFLNHGVVGTSGGTISVAGNGTGSFANWLGSTNCSTAPSAGGCGTIVDLNSFSPFTPITSFISVTENGKSVSFDLNDLAVITRTPATGLSSAVLAFGGNGMIHASGFQDTAGTFMLTTAGGNGSTFSGETVAGGNLAPSITNAAVADVPEPASILLLGGALLTLGAATRRRRRQKLL